MAGTDNNNKKRNNLEIIRTFWPIVVIVCGIVVWLLKAQTVSYATFIELEKRVTAAEVRIPDSAAIKLIHDNQVRMTAQLETMAHQLERITLFNNSIMKRVIDIDLGRRG